MSTSLHYLVHAVMLLIILGQRLHLQDLTGPRLICYIKGHIWSRFAQRPMARECTRCGLFKDDGTIIS